MNHIFRIRTLNYLEALKKLYSNQNLYFKKTKKRLLPLEAVEARFEICKNCDGFTGLKCKYCNCCTNIKQSHFNKLAFPTEQCPHPDGPKFYKIENL